MRYDIKVILEDGTERKLWEKTRAKAEGAAETIVLHRQAMGERCTVKVYLRNVMVALVNQKTIERKRNLAT